MCQVAKLDSHLHAFRATNPNYRLVLPLMPSFKRRLYAITPSHRQEENRTRTFSRVEAPDETDPRPNALLLGSSTA